MFNIYNIENRFKKELEDTEEWTYLRNYYREANSYNIDGRSSINKIELLKQIFYGFTNWFKRYDYIIFSSTDARKLINNKYYDIRSDYIYTLLGKKDKVIIVETPLTFHKDHNEIYTKNIVSRRFLDVIALILEKMDKNSYSINILNEINKWIKIDFNYKSIIRRFNSRYKIYKLWFKLIKPKAVFINCYYDKQYVIKAAKELNIKVIEIQHGLINQEHSAYFSKVKLNKFYLPDYIFVFNKSDKQLLQKNSIFNKDNIFVVGNFYLDYLRDNFQKDKELSSIIANYKISIGVSLQWTIENEMIDFINNVAKDNTDIVFILIPREFDEKKYNKLNLEKNVIFYPKLDCYSIIMHCNYHCTVYSTCAIEAQFLGIKNILINLNGLSVKFLQNIIDDKTLVINNKNDIQQVIELSIENNEKIFLLDYKKNIKKALKYILKID